MNALLLLGRILFGGFFILSGISHFKNVTMMGGYARAKGTPAPEAAVLGTGALLLLGGLSILLGVYVQVGIVLLIIFLLGTTFQIHAYWKVTDPQARMGERVNFMKNLALLGALLMLLALPWPWPLSLGH